MSGQASGSRFATTKMQGEACQCEHPTLFVWAVRVGTNDEAGGGGIAA